jgi:hypothetical protein
MAQLIVLIKIIVETSRKQVESFMSNGQWKCIYVAWFYVSMPYTSRNTSCKVIVNWGLHLH